MQLVKIFARPGWFHHLAMYPSGTEEQLAGFPVEYYDLALPHVAA